MVRKTIIIACALACSAAAFGQEKKQLGGLKAIEVTCGEITLLLREFSQWTPGRFDYRGKAVSTESSAYGTVFRIPDVGFIGTGHLENEPEQIDSLSLFVDGKAEENPAATISAEKSFRFVRESRIRQFQLRCEWEIRDNRLFETATVSSEKGGDLEYIYHFMHAWQPSVSAFVAGLDGEGIVDSGDLRDGDGERKFFINRAVDWVGVYEPESGQFAVSRLLSEPESVPSRSKVWKVPGAYRKYYFTCFENATVPAGFTGTWKMVTAFGACQEKGWEAEAEKLAAATKKD